MNPLPPLVGIALGVTLALPVAAQQAGFATETVVRVAGISAGGTLNVRAGAGTDTPVVASLASGEAGLTILECNASAAWCRVGGARGPLGWVAARYLAAADAPAARTPAAATVAPPAEPRFSEADRLARAIGAAIAPGATVTVPELPPYLLGAWDDDRATCANGDSATRVTVLKNGLRIGAATARFKSAVFRGGGYDLTTLLMQERGVMNAVPQRALYRLEPGEATLAISGDVLSARRLRRCTGA